MNQHTNTNLKHKLFTATVILFPVFSIYGINIGTITIADMMLIIQFPILCNDLLLNNLIKKETIKNIISLPFVIYIVYIIFQLLFVIMIISNISDVTMRTLRYLFYLINICLFFRKYFVFNYGMKLYKFVGIFSVCFIMYQIIVFLLFRKYIPGYIPYLTVLREELVEYSNNVAKNAGYMRPRSIFAEPAHFAQYVVGLIALILFSSKEGRNKYFWLYF
ncbi:MAG: hypothetical protein LBE13_14190 [Bacteroidales bacterium]|jgi:hypothetical protein|nr:hypothetical protein [Bacteroidales bacterium]